MNIPTNLVGTEQPEERVFEFDGIFVKQTMFHRAGTVAPQHSHKWDHLTTIARGSVRVWGNGELLGEFAAPHGIVIKAGVKHTFLTLEDETIVHCTHNISRLGVVEIESEHQLEGIS